MLIHTKKTFFNLLSIALDSFCLITEISWSDSRRVFVSHDYYYKKTFVLEMKMLKITKEYIYIYNNKRS